MPRERSLLVDRGRGGRRRRTHSARRGSAPGRGDGGRACRALADGEQAARPGRQHVGDHRVRAGARLPGTAAGGADRRAARCSRPPRRRRWRRRSRRPLPRFPRFRRRPPSRRRRSRRPRPPAEKPASTCGPPPGSRRRRTPPRPGAARRVPPPPPVPRRRQDPWPPPGVRGGPVAAADPGVDPGSMGEGRRDAARASPRRSRRTRGSSPRRPPAAWPAAALAAPSNGAGSPPWPSVGGSGPRRPRRGLLLGGTAAAIIVLYLVIAAVAQTFPFSKATPKPTTGPKVVVSTASGCPTSPTRPRPPRRSDVRRLRHRPRSPTTPAGGPWLAPGVKPLKVLLPTDIADASTECSDADGHPVDEPRPGAGDSTAPLPTCRAADIFGYQVDSTRDFDKAWANYNAWAKFGKSKLRGVPAAERVRRRPARSSGTTATSRRARARCSSASPRARARACTSGRTRPRTRSSSCRRPRAGRSASCTSGGGSTRHEPRGFVLPDARRRHLPPAAAPHHPRGLLRLDQGREDPGAELRDRRHDVAPGGVGAGPGAGPGVRPGDRLRDRAALAHQGPGARSRASGGSRCSR